MTIGRPLEFDPEVALDAAVQLFWRQGYEATSVQDLLEVTGLSKSSLYQSFGSKHELFERCMVAYREELVRQLREKLACHTCGLDFVQEVLEGVAAEARSGGERRGCLLMNTATEFAQRDPEIAEHVRRGTEAVAAVFAEAVRKGQEAGRIDASTPPKVLGRYLVSVVSGLKTMVKAGAGPREIRSTVEVALRGLRPAV